MDLIYQDTDRTDLGVLKNYEMDLAYGKDENDFEVSMDLDEHCLKEGYILYMEGTEYGGIVDKIKASNVDDTVIYSGRTWHGILEGKIMEPVGNHAYLLLSGNANEVLRYLIESWNLSDLFSVEDGDSPVEIVDYHVGYVKGYTGIRQMLYKFGGKLQIRYRDGRAVLSAVPYVDYSQDEEFDSSQVCFTCEKDYRPLNHLICKGLGDENELYVIHLFSDAYKGIQPYAKSDAPYQDTDYILTKEKQQLFGKDEVTDLYDANSIQAVKNYRRITWKPEGWDADADTWNDRFPDVYILNDDGKYTKAEAKKADVYVLQTREPYDWLENYGDYYIRGNYINGDWTYEHPEFNEKYSYSLLTRRPFKWEMNYEDYYTKETTVDGMTTTVTYKKVEPAKEKIATLLETIPGDWADNYGNYYVKYNDGVKLSYKSVSAETKYYYKKQTKQPTDWKTNYGSYYKKSGEHYISQPPVYKQQAKKPADWAKNYREYYQRVSDGTTTTYQQISAVQKDYYEVQTKQPTDWKTNYKNYYTKGEKEYESIDAEKAPTWVKKMYYTKKTKQEVPKYDKVKPVYAATAPEWGKAARYTRFSKQVAPAWKKNTYYIYGEYEGAPPWEPDKYYRNCPEWEVDTYYTKVNQMMPPSWHSRVYFRQYLDHYAKLVEKGLEQFEKKRDTDKLDISLELESTYDINDIVGASEHVTGQSVWMPITKKIVKITDTSETIEYEVGE